MGAHRTPTGARGVERANARSAPPETSASPERAFDRIEPPARPLPDALEELAPQLVRGVEAQLATSSAPEMALTRCRASWPAVLMRQLVAALRGQRVDATTCVEPSAIATDVEPFVRTLRLLKEAVYAAIDERGIAVSPREMRLAAEWFGGMTEEALRAANRRFAGMLDALPDHVVLHDPEGRIVYFNRAAAEAAKALSGQAPGALIGRTLLEVDLPEAFRQNQQADVVRVLRGESVRSEFLLPTPDGGRWFEHRLAPVFDARGVVEAVAVASRDIHARKVAEQRLRQSEARFRVALAQSNIAVFEEGTDLRVRWMYDAQRGGDDRSTVGKGARDFLPADVSAELEAAKRRVLETGAGVLTSVDAVVGGQRRHLRINYEPLRSDGAIVGITGAVVDITEARRVQEELAEAVEFRERVMGVLGHDLRNPLNAVLMTAGLLQRDEAAPDRVREGLARVVRSARRMDEMIRTILDVTRLRSGHGVPLSREPAALDAVAREVLDELRAANPGRVLEVAASGDLRGYWDVGRIGQVVSNLVANALAHGAPESPIRLALSRHGGEVVMAVTNHGPTIPEAFAAKLFEPFWQAPTDGGSTTTRRRGLGLGLFIVKQIVQAHGGTVDVDSRDGVTTFTVRIPVGTVSGGPEE